MNAKFDSDAESDFLHSCSDSPLRQSRLLRARAILLIAYLISLLYCKAKSGFEMLRVEFDVILRSAGRSAHAEHRNQRIGVGCNIPERKLR